MRNTVFGGLLHKEWIVLKWLLALIILLDVVVITLAPLLTKNFAGIPDTLYDTTHIIVGTWFALHIFSGVFMLFVSLKKEMKNLEMWLHSPHPMVQLVGAKVVFAILAALASLFFSSLLASIVLYVIGDWTMELAWSGVLALISVVLAISIKLVFMTMVGWFFWSVYKVVNSRTQFFSVPLVFIFFIITFVFWEQLRVSGLFDWLRTIVPVRLTNESFYNEHTSYFFMGFVPNGIAFSLGNLVFYLIISFVLLMIGSAFFEKKVRV
ncbi:hypothetical protein [Sporosarcina ureae]|uniref:hypothetical protein n=1 Tax=Sporosarcina ureae TaxID=1571 RepID=UPI0028AB66FA|nr:hypothetical protein [Sporosarcina ureae]